MMLPMYAGGVMSLPICARSDEVTYPSPSPSIQVNILFSCKQAKQCIGYMSDKNMCPLREG